nr:NADH dehydrogenase [ubiquinone] 1 alpha subcomplex subunit 5 [Megalopta genalis]
MSRILKKTTGLTGLAVNPQARENLMKVYSQVLAALAILPQESAYRRNTEAIVKERNAIVQQNTNVADIENKIGYGQIEELLLQAQDELILAQRMSSWKPWESLTEEAPSHQWTWPPRK